MNEVQRVGEVIEATNPLQTSLNKWLWRKQARGKEEAKMKRKEKAVNGR